jgi:hypothetical protein
MYTYEMMSTLSMQIRIPKYEYSILHKNGKNKYIRACEQCTSKPCYILLFFM